MYQHIFVPTDGSERSLHAAREAAALAHAIGARITGFFAGPEFPGLYVGDGLVIDPAAVDEHRRAVEELAQRHLNAIGAIAREAGVAYDSAHTLSEVPWAAIVEAAAEHGCDAIVMASHGHGALGSLLLGSQTIKVLAHTKLPVLVCR
jgi:nucleotide-binding universal stress UspA family protein